MLLFAGANPNTVDEDGITPIVIASLKGHHRVVETLLVAGVDVRTTVFEKLTSIHAASRYGHHQVVEILLAAGANPNLWAKNGGTPILSAINGKSYKIVELFLASGVDLQSLPQAITRAQLGGFENIALLLQSGLTEESTLTIRERIATIKNRVELKRARYRYQTCSLFSLLLPLLEDKC